jgi:nitrogenase molybdenum-iron protein beta chain
MGVIIDRPRFDCAIGGALALARAIPRVIPIAHASKGCASNYYSGGSPGAGYLGGAYCGSASVPSTNVSEKEIVFGGEARLEEQIRSTIELMDGDLYLVLSGCMVELIGDDIKGLVDGLDVPETVLAVATPSFKGNANHGYDQVLELLIREFVGRQEKKKNKKVNVFGLIPGGDVFYKGNLKEIKRVLSLIGVEANTLIGERETLADIKSSGDAELNIILSDVYAPLSEKAFKEVHDIPSIREALPIGFLQTEIFLKGIGDALGISSQVIETALKPEEEVYFDYFERISDAYNDLDFQRYAVVVSDANYAGSLARFASDELGWIPHLAMITDPLRNAEQLLLLKRFEGFASGLKPQVHFNSSTSALRRCLASSWERNHAYCETLGPLVLFGSTFDRELAEEYAYAFLNISFPVTNRVIFNRAYSGVNGGLTLAEDVFALLVAGR